MKDLIVHCPTKELWDKVQEKMVKEGLRWADGGTNYDEWNMSQEASCICSLKKDEYKMMREDRSYFERKLPSIKILSAEEYLQEPFEDKSAKEQGIDTSRYFTDVVGYAGDLLQIKKDDDSKNPLFWDITRYPNKESYVCSSWSNLRYATQEEIDAVIGRPELSSPFTSDGAEHNLLTQPQLLDYIKKHGPTKAKGVDGPFAGVISIFRIRGGDIEGDKTGYYTKTFEGLFEIVKEEEKKPIMTRDYIGFVPAFEVKKEPTKSLKEKTMNSIENLSVELQKIIPGDKKKQYQAGLRYGDMTVTDEAKKFMWSLLADQFNKELTEESEKRIKKAEKDK